MVAAFAGAAMLGYVSHFGEIIRYPLGSWIAVITPIKLVMGTLMLVFALFEIVPCLREIKFDHRHLVLGGILSGLFGGFSGHQGALRSAFLVKMGVTTEAFVGSNAAIGCMVDLARIITYTGMFFVVGGVNPLGADQWPLILVATLAAFSGVMIGKRFLHKITMKTVQTLTGVLLLGIALALGLGIV
jgi:uncharacterized membrane protein YfcA